MQGFPILIGDARKWLVIDDGFSAQRIFFGAFGLIFGAYRHFHRFARLEKQTLDEKFPVF